MNYSCHKCKKELSLDSPDRVGRRESCPFCQADLHACKNCTHYDLKAYNNCRETSAERVVDKEKSNYCDYFAFKDAQAAATGGEKKTEGKKNLDDLFK